MTILSMTTWESVVGFCRSIFDMMQGFFNESLLAEIGKTRVVLGQSFSYASLCFGGFLLFIIGRKIVAVISGF